MALDRDALIDALVERLRVKMPDLRTLSRGLRHWDDVPAAEQPACFVALGENAPSYGAPDAPVTWRVNAVIYLYAAADEETAPSIGALVKELETALERDMELDWREGAAYPALGRYTTLGGRCQYARIGAPIQTDEGTLGAQAVARVYVEMVASG